MTRVLGIDFYQGTASSAIELALKGGLTVAPSGPNLAEMDLAPMYHHALNKADLIVLDSGFLVLCWRMQQGQRLSRLSGLLLVETMLASQSFQSESEQLWVMPTMESATRTRTYLADQGVTLSPDCFYTAPYYPTGKIEDQELLQRIRQQQPRLIMINVAGGKQEVLGAWLMENLPYRPAIICTGAAIAFLTGEQANIPSWGDRFFLGWLLRIFHDPKRYVSRYWNARRLWRLLKRYGAESPAIQGGLS
ncbi:WecB/TagA/CpsF family glycosyltransferase [Cerasicoccus arenae]|uniref:Glycosyltransferase n=1 Tax=Cerasicoccus arenae TaxID=424488 RepID=A0A8J3DFJ1_9BACT|nr:WecB/TagA/CpsF family glycosyltransferase [Cerasicoccus arenae]MBK1857502.1 WecB/TagA/CpsF family glycosyltransferase [Cerasicoccus arenae]GHB95390.1 hypothetical protein GCM10007047_08910 [Cerasicoccus arenae]